MTFTESIKTCLKDKYATFRERAPRSEFWWFVLFGIIAGAVANVLDTALGFAPEATFETGESGIGASYQATGPISVILSLVLLIPNLAVSARRLHDTGRSAWWLLIVLIPLLGILVLIWFWTRPSEEGPNKWGPNPFDPSGTIAHDGASYARSRVPTVDREDR